MQKRMKFSLFFIFLLFMILFFPQVLFAQIVGSSQSALQNLTPTITEINYDLPYPGILPDNPLYPIKVFRDKVIDFLISDSLKKAQFDLLQADKRLNAGVYLAKEHGDKDRYISSVISKAENYFELALAQTITAKKQGVDISLFVQRLIMASQKHEQVIQDLYIHASSSLQHDLIQQQQRVRNFEKQAKAFTLQTLPK